MPAALACLRRITAVWLAAVACATPADATDGDLIQFRVEMYAIAGLHVMTVLESLRESAQAYSIAMRLQSRGLADLFASIDSRTDVAGRIVDGRPYSQSFHSDIRRGSREAVTTAAFDAGGVVSFGRDPPLADPRNGMTPELLRAAIDEHSAYYWLERQLARSGSCALTVPVFDGLHRFDLVFADLPRAAADPKSDFTAPTMGCAVTRRNLAGFAAGSGNDGVSHARMWFAHLLPGMLLLPVRMELDTEIGIVTGYLAEVHGRGVDLASGR